MKTSCSVAKRILVVDGLNDITTTYCLPIISGLASEFAVSKVYFYKFPVGQLAKSLNFDFKFSSFTEIQTIPFNSKELLTRLRRALYLFLLALRIKNSDLLDGKQSFSVISTKHALWDLSMKLAPDGVTSPQLWSRLRAASRLIKIEYLAIFLSRYPNSIAFLGHNVYERRLLMARLRELNYKIYFHANYSVCRQLESRDILPTIPTPELLGWLDSQVTRKEIDSFWRRRLEGETQNMDTKAARRIKSAEDQQREFDAAVLLPIFRDSPYLIIDQGRIFADYADFLEVTLKTIVETNERWLIKLHPSRLRWGENSILFVQRVLKKLGIKKLPDNLSLDEQAIDHASMFFKLKKVVTYRGTSHVESAAAGVKPIVISSCLLTETAPHLTIKPKEVNEYVSLLRQTDYSQFSLTDANQRLAQKLLYYREEVVPFTRDIGGRYYFQRDSKEVIEEISSRVSRGALVRKTDLERYGVALARGLPQTASLRFANYLIAQNEASRAKNED